MNLPNKISTFRLMLIPVFAVIFYVDFPFHYIVAAAVFGLAAFTDFLDGYIARKYNMVTDLGKFLDSSADKVLVLVALILIVDSHLLAPVWGGAFTAIIVAREIMVSCLRMVAAAKGFVMAADKLGKWKTFLQDVGIVIDLVAGDTDAAALIGVNFAVIYWIGFAIIAASVVMTIVSGLHYFVVNKRVLSQKGKTDN